MRATTSKITFTAVIISLLGVTSCASSKYNVRSPHEFRASFIDKGQVAESVAVEANKDYALTPGLWVLSASGYETSYIYVPDANPNQTIINLRKEGTSSPGRLVRDIFEIQNQMRRKNNADALEKVRRLRSIYPDIVELSLLQSSIMVMLGDTSGASLLLKDIIKANPDDSAAKNLFDKISSEGAKP